MARGARFALVASNPPPPRGLSRRRVRWWTCAPAIEGGKSCKKNPRHSTPTSSALFLPFSLSRSFRRFLTLRCPPFRSTPAGNRRRLYLSAGHAVASLLPILLVFSLSLPRPLPLSLPLFLFFVLRLDPLSSRTFKRDVCMYGPVYAAFMWNSWGEHREKRLITRCQRNARRPCVCVHARVRACAHAHPHGPHDTPASRAR